METLDPHGHFLGGQPLHRAAGKILLAEKVMTSSDSNVGKLTSRIMTVNFQSAQILPKHFFIYIKLHASVSVIIK